MQRFLIYLAVAMLSFNLPGAGKVKAIGSPALPVVPETSGGCVAPPSGLVGWWPGEGNGNDLVSSNNGAVVNVSFTNGVVGQAFSFDPESYPYGTYTGVQIADSPAYVLTNSLTIEGWIRPRGDSYLIFWRGDSRPGLDPYALSMQGNNELDFNITDVNGNTTVIKTTLNYNQWTYVAATLDDATGTMSLYTNSVLAAQTVTSFRPMGELISDQHPGIGIGNLNDGLNNFPFIGDIDEIALYNRALSTNEITAIYNAGSAGKCPVSIPPPATNCVSPPSGIIGWWQGDNNVFDSIGGNDGLSLNEVGYTNGEVRQAFSFAGPDFQQSVDIPYAPALISTNYSVEAWVNPAGPVNSDIGQALIFGQSYGQVQLVVRSGVSGIVPVFQFGTDKYTFYEVDATSEIPIGTFTHLAGTWDGITLRLYINGVLNNAVTPGAIPVDSGCDFFIGGFNHSASDSCNYVGQFFTGAIDEVSFYNRALPATEIQALYNAGDAGKCTSNSAASSPPNIISQPVSQTVLAGSNVVFSVMATGANPLAYQWKFNGANISKATNATLTLADLHSNQSGNYQVRISNSFGSVSSDAALLSVIAQNLLVYNYSGSEKVTTAGQELSYNYIGKMFFNPADTNGVFIGWATINKKKQYWISPFSDYRMISIPGAAKHVYTVLGKAGSEVDAGGQPHIWSFLHTGLNATLAIGTRKTFSFPNTFSCDDTQVYPDPQSGNMILRSAVSTYAYSSSATQAANNNGSTLTDLVNAETASLIRQGYRQQ